LAFVFDKQMGLTNGFTPVPGSPDDIKRTHSKLVVSEGTTPAEKWIVDPRLKRLFKYQFGGPGWVVIPKGRIVALSADGGPANDGRFKGYITRHIYQAITLANGGVDVANEVAKDGTTYTRKANQPVGVALYNIYEQKSDDMADILPNIIRADKYIEVPYFQNKADADAIHWGCAYGALKGGDYLCSDANGRFVKWEEYKTKVQNFANITPSTGTVTVYVNEPIKAGVEPTFEVTLVSDNSLVTGATLGEVLYAQGKVTLENCGANPVNVAITYVTAIPGGYDQIVGRVYAVDTNLPPEGWLKWAQWAAEDRKLDADWNNWGLRPEDFENGPLYLKKYRDQVWGEEIGQGIPGLTNASNIEVQYTDEKIGEIQAGVAANTTHHFYTLHKPVVEGSLTVKIGGVEVVPDYVDYPSGLIIVKNPTQYTTKQDVTATYKATGQIPGVPTNWDFKGSLGAVRIMLLGFN